jgi:hypothetical protein
MPLHAWRRRTWHTAAKKILLHGEKNAKKAENPYFASFLGRQLSNIGISAGKQR